MTDKNIQEAIEILSGKMTVDYNEYANAKKVAAAGLKELLEYRKVEREKSAKD